MKPISHISHIRFGECVDSMYVKPCRMMYKENGNHRCWDFIHSLDSVAVLLYHRDSDSLLFVRQFRPAVFAQMLGRDSIESKKIRSVESANRVDSADFIESSPASAKLIPHAYTYELCAGLCDKVGKSKEQIAKEEVLEECGYNVRRLTYITTFATAVGHSGASQSLFYADISEKDRANMGGGIDGEVIESVLVRVDALDAFLNDESKIKTPGLGFGVLWFLRHYVDLKQGAEINNKRNI